MMRTRIPYVCLCAMLLCAGFLLSGCADSKQELEAMKQKVKDLNDDLKVVKGHMTDLQLEIDVMNEQLTSLQKKGVQSADSGQIQGLETRLSSVEGEFKKIRSEMQEIEKKAEARPTVARQVASSSSSSTKSESGSSEKVIEAKPEIKKSAAPARSEPTRVKGRYYTVKQGESIRAIAATFNVDEDRLRTLNRIPAGRKPLPGAKIFIPQ